MTKLELVIERLKALPPDEQEGMAMEIEAMLDGGESLLTAEQWAEVERELAEDDGEGIPHAEVVAKVNARIAK